MFQELFTNELATRVGSMVEVFTDGITIEGILTAVSSEVIVIREVANSYGDSSRSFVPVNSVNFARFSPSR